MRGVLSYKKIRFGIKKLLGIENCLNLVDTEGRMQNFRTLGQPHLGKSNPRGRRERDRKKKNAIISGHYVPSATPKGSARTSFGLITKDYFRPTK